MTEQDQQGASCREVEDRVAAAEAETEPVAMSDKDGGEGTGEQAIVLSNPLMVGEHCESTNNPAVVACTTMPLLVGEHSEGIGDLAMVLYDPSILGEHGEGTGEQATVPYSPLFGESEHSDSDDELEWVQENAALLAAMEVDDISQRCSPGTYDSCLIDGHPLPPGHVAIVIPSTALDEAAGPPQKHQTPSYLKIHSTLQMYRKASCDGKVKLLLDLFYTWPKLLIGVQHALLMQNENERAERRRDLKRDKATHRMSSRGSATSSAGRPSSGSLPSSGTRQSIGGAASSSGPASSTE
jgi:hypothetical protein